MSGDDLLKGAKAIGEFLGVSRDTAQRLITQERIPAFRFSPRGQWRAKKTELAQYIAQLAIPCHKMRQDGFP